MSSAYLDRALLPDAVEPLKDLVVQLAQQLQAVREQADAQMANLAQQLAALRQRLFGRSSEVLHVGQAELWGEQVELPVPPETRERVGEHHRRRRGRPAIDPKLPRVRVEHDLSEQEKAQFSRVQCIGEEISETIEYTPAKLVVLQHARLKYRCEDEQGGSTVRTASAITSPLARSNAGPGLLAQVLVSKYVDHNPLARQERGFGRHGIVLPRQTLCDWTLGSCELLARLVPALKAHLLASPVIFTDDTTLALQAGRGAGTGKTITARLWCYLAGGHKRDATGQWQPVAPAALYDFTTDRSAAHPRRMLAGWSGWLQADDYAGYHGLFKGGGIIHAACWAHARRRYMDVVKTAPPGAPPGLAHEALRYIGELYHIEREIAEADPEQKLLQRQCRSRPLLTDFHRWLTGHVAALLPQSALGKAVAYTLSNWQALTAFVDEGMLAVDNNTSERAMRPIAISRKNWLFAGSERGGQAAAVALSLVETAKLNGLEPYAYLKDVLSRINGCRLSQLEGLLPMHWEPA